MSPNQLHVLCQISGSVPLGSGVFATSQGFVRAPAGASLATQSVPIATVAGSVSDIFDGAQTIVSSGSPVTLTLSSLTDPGGTNSAFLHITHLLIENTSTTNTVTVAPGASHGVTWLPAAGIVLPSALSATQTTWILLAVPAGLAIALGSTDTISLTSSGGSNIIVNVTVLGRST